MATKKQKDLTQFINSLELDLGAYKPLGKLETRLESKLKIMLKQERLFLLMQEKINHINAEWIEDEWEEFFEEKQEDKEELLLAQYLLAYEHSQQGHKEVAQESVIILPTFDYYSKFDHAVDDIFKKHENNLNEDQKKAIKNSFSKTNLLKSMNDALTETQDVRDSPSSEQRQPVTHEDVIRRVKLKLNISDDSVKKVHEQLINKVKRPQWSYPLECSFAKEYFILERLCTLNRILGIELDTEPVNSIQESFLSALCDTIECIELGPLESLITPPPSVCPGFN
jgi:hypothetical protein